MELRPVTAFYQKFTVATVGEDSVDVPNPDYNPDFTTSDDYLLFVHGFNVNATDKIHWPDTIFKRLCWQGYKGHFGWFDWPCKVVDLFNLPPQFYPQIYDDSEYIAGAKMRVNRALEKLRTFFTTRGLTLSAAAIAGAISANSVHAAPLGLATSVTVAAVKGTTVTTSTLTLIETTLKAMAWTKLKTAMVVGAIAILAAGTATVSMQHISRATRGSISRPDVQL